MDRNEFIKKQLMKFGCFNEINSSIWQKDYEEVLQEPNINYVVLDRTIIHEWSDTFKAPAPDWVEAKKKDCLIKEQADTRCQALKDIHEMREQSANMSDSEIARIDEIRARMRKTLGKVKG